MEVLVSQQLYYSTQEQVSAKEVADSLLALEGLLKSCPPILQQIFPGVIIESVNIYVDEIIAGSLYEDLFVKFIFGSQENFDVQLSGLRKKVGMDMLDKHPNLLGAILGAMILGGGLMVYDLINKEPSESRATIEANNNTIINIGAGELGIEAKDLSAIIKGAIEKDPTIGKNAVAVVAPAKRSYEGRISINQSDDLIITPETVRAMPAMAPGEPDEPDEIIEDFDSLTLEIRATDLDSIKRGWAAVPVGLGEKRVRLQLDPTVKPEDLQTQRHITGAATVVFLKQGDKKTPRLVFLRSIKKDNASH